jgi:hypothetical protein
MAYKSASLDLDVILFGHITNTGPAIHRHAVEVLDALDVDVGIGALLLGSLLANVET